MSIPEFIILSELERERMRISGHSVFLPASLCSITEGLPEILHSWFIGDKQERPPTMVPNYVVRSWMAEAGIEFALDTIWRNGCDLWLIDKDDAVTMKIKFDLADQHI